MHLDPVYLAWKTHRLFLKHWPGWGHLPFPLPKAGKVRYFAEGSRYYLFLIQGCRDKLLRISKRQYYFGPTCVEAVTLERLVTLYSLLAQHRLAPETTHLDGEAFLVDRITELLTSHTPRRAEMCREFFARLAGFSEQTGWVLTDFVAGNFGVRNGQLLLLDVEMAMSCRLAEIAENPVARRRLAGATSAHSSPMELLRRFYSAEEKLLQAAVSA